MSKYNGVKFCLAVLLTTNCAALKFMPRCNFNLSFKESAKDIMISNKLSWQRNCSINLEKVCRQNILASYIELQPFTNSKVFNSGIWPANNAILQQILSAALSQCCGNCLKITFKKFRNRSELTHIKTKELSDIIFPMFTQGVPNRLNTTTSPLTIPIIKLSTAMFITTLTIQPKLFATEVLQAIVDLWPLFGVALMCAIVAGIVVWFLDTWSNAEQFPRRFIPGSFEGFWWSFISMTTVGYGDIAPNSRAAKLLAIFWILCGITITSLMTAALTTAISEVSNRHQASSSHGNIGILKDHIFEKILVMKGNAKPIYMNNVDEILEAIKTKKIDGMLIDTYTAKKLLKQQMEDENNKLFVRELIHDVDQSYYGVTIFDENLYNLINEYIEYQRDHINDFIYELVNSLPEFQSSTIEANVLFTTQSGVYKEMLYFCSGIILIFLLFGLIYEICCQKCQTKKVSSSLLKFEEKMEVEFSALARKWKKQLQNNTTIFTVNGSFVFNSKEDVNISLNIVRAKLTNELVIVNNENKSKTGNYKKIQNKKKKKKTEEFHINIKNDQGINKKRPLPVLTA